MVLSGILTRATYGRERIYGHADVTAANGLERGPRQMTRLTSADLVRTRGREGGRPPPSLSPHPARIPACNEAWGAPLASRPSARRALLLCSAYVSTSTALSASSILLSFNPPVLPPSVSLLSPSVPLSLS